MIDWTRLRPNQIGLAVEGEDDKILITAFLDAGEQQTSWSGWKTRIAIETAGKYDNVLKEVEQEHIWGIIDRDWRAPGKIDALSRQNPRLLVLPRVMIENFLLAPDELFPLFPPSRRNAESERAVQSAIETALNEWIGHGALSAVLHENGAEAFCRSPSGYPGALLNQLITDERAILSQLQGWHGQLEPGPIVEKYRQRLADFRQLPLSSRYRDCIDGKMFFRQVIVPTLNQLFGQQRSDWWLQELAGSISRQPCPSDLIVTLQALFN